MDIHCFDSSTAIRPVEFSSVSWIVTIVLVLTWSTLWYQDVIRRYMNSFCAISSFCVKYIFYQTSVSCAQPSKKPVHPLCSKLTSATTACVDKSYYCTSRWIYLCTKSSSAARKQRRWRKNLRWSLSSYSLGNRWTNLSRRGKRIHLAEKISVLETSNTISAVYENMIS